jgi:hypothetical protein
MLIKKTFVFTYDRYEDITTSEWLKGIPHTVLCHTKEQEKQFLKAGRIHGKLIATGSGRGLTYNRNVALDMMKPGEWAVFWVDDLIRVRRYQNYFTYKGTEFNVQNGKNQNLLRKLFKETCSPEEFYKIAEETATHAESKGYALCGFALTDNPQFRKKKFIYGSLADGRCWLVKKTDLRFDEAVQIIDDVCFTALNKKFFGGVVVNNWCITECRRYTEGAFGTLPQRMDQRIAECKYLVEHYPDTIRYAQKKYWPPHSHVMIR